MEVWWLLQPARNSSRWSWAKNTSCSFARSYQRILKTQWWASSPFNMAQFPLSGGILAFGGGGPLDSHDSASLWSKLQFNCKFQLAVAVLAFHQHPSCRMFHFTLVIHSDPSIFLFPNKCKTLTFGVGPFVLPPVESTTSVLLKLTPKQKWLWNFRVTWKKTWKKKH